MSKYTTIFAVIAGLVLALGFGATPALGANWDGGPSGTGTDFSTNENWVGDAGPGADAWIDNASGTFSVEVNDTAPSVGTFLRVYRGAELTINTGGNLTVSGGGDLLIDYAGGSTVTMNDGTLRVNDKMKLGEMTLEACKFYMKGGTFSAGDDIEVLNSTSFIEFSGGSFTSEVPLELGTGLLRVIGNGATITLDAIDADGNSQYEFVPNAAGQISAVTSGDTKAGDLTVNLDLLTAPSTMTLFDGGWVDPFNSSWVTITQGATTLSAGTSGSLALNEYAITYPGANSMVLEVNVVPEPATMSLLALGGLALLRRRRRA